MMEPNKPNETTIENTPRNARLIAMMNACANVIVQLSGVQALASDCDQVTGQMCGAAIHVVKDLSNQLVNETMRSGNDGSRIHTPDGGGGIKIVKPT